jgi:hypothetical protein
VEVTHRENTERKTTKVNNEILAKTIRIHSPHGNVRPELAKANPWRRRGNNNIVAYLLETRIVKLGKQPLLANGSEKTFVPKQLKRYKGTTSIARQHILNKQE